ncbi:GH15053 [Drosophila grimshawi]|uniref:GH15053 n=2 Tax=Drosophila grimshawi TaxID=7222 RepID=B4IZU3_DROGR|nr:GH15053 [Drosophila grimshawi]
MSLPGDGSTAYSKTLKENRSKPSKTSNYFLHQPYGPNTYAFGYEVDDAQTGNVQFRDESRYQNGSIAGSYGFVRQDGLVQVTRYKTDENGGYLAHSQSYSPGDQQVDTIWPQQLPQLFNHRHQLEPAQNVSWDARNHLNVSVDQVEQTVADHLKQHGLDLFNINVTEDLLHSTALDIVNGRTPLKRQPNGSLAFEILQDFLPNNLPVVPFELKAKELTTTSAEPMHEKYNKAKTNNDEKAPQVAAEVTNVLPTPKPLVSSSSNESNWYQQIIQANRRQFLEQLPNLSEANA